MDRYGFYAEKLRESMKGITTSEFILIRILVGRSEKDLSDIRAYFEEKEYGDGKTFKQCLHNHLKGSFRTSLARIAGVYEDGQHECNESDYESQTESSLVDHIHGGHQVAAAVPPPSMISSKSVGFLPEAPSTPTKSCPEPSRHKIVVTSPQEKENGSRDSEPGYGLSIDAVEEPEYDPYDINEQEFGKFITDKVNEKTANRLMQHLKNGSRKDLMNNNSNEDSADVIKAHQVRLQIGTINFDGNLRTAQYPRTCVTAHGVKVYRSFLNPLQAIHVLLFACVLYLKYKEKTEKRPEINIDKKKVRRALMPSYNWMMSNKLNINPAIQRSNYKILGQWLKEYYAQK